MRLTMAIAVCVMASTGCEHRAASDAEAPSAKKLFSDPEQLRLAEAVARGDAAGIGEALRLGADIDAPGREGIRMLMWAMLMHSVEGFNALLDRDANLMARHFDPTTMNPGQKRYTVAELACVFPDKRFLKAILARGFDPNRIVDQDAGETMVFYAVFRHDTEAARCLIDAGARVDHQNKSGTTPLALAVSICDYRVAMLLYSRGGDPSAKDRTGYSVIDALKFYGSRGVTPEQKPYFDDFVAALEKRGLITQNDIVEADKPKDQGGTPGITVIEHPAGSDTGRAIKSMERSERDSRRRGNR